MFFQTGIPANRPVDRISCSFFGIFSDGGDDGRRRVQITDIVLNDQHRPGFSGFTPHHRIEGHIIDFSSFNIMVYNLSRFALF